MRKTTILSVLIIILFACCRGQSNSVSTIHSEGKFPVDTSLIPNDSTTLFFPLNSFNSTSKNIQLDSFVVKWYSEQLFALKEPIVYVDKSEKEIYRFTWLRTFHNPAAIRIEKCGESYVLYWKLSNGAGGYQPGKLIINKQKVLDKKTWDEFLSKINQIDFWNLPTKQDDMGYDGSEWILEGKSISRYHVVNRWTPNKGSRYYECCDFLLGLTDLKIKGRDKY